MQALPLFDGASGEWLDFKATFRDTKQYFSNTENLIRLRRSLKGMAKEAVNCLFYGETNPEEVMRTLKARLAAARKVNNIVATMKTANRENYQDNSAAVRIVLEKLTPSLLCRYYAYIAAQHENLAESPHMAEFLNREADAPRRRTYIPGRAYPVKRDRYEYNERTQRTNVRHRAHHTAKACPLCNSDHLMSACAKLKEATVEECWEPCKKGNAYFECLIKRQLRHRCPTNPCGVDSS
ncbi:hypothetical protein EVAR_30345_1 [Eumeta japonica]|uniref:Uncharacterized protein n=1 Tax=Eumeta variegata TaxID=151549 RepID=A0A4C1W9B3_EUMVA|nr:hypothetical protein EVAR_30345_1 [Eumeta japonica]